MKTHYDILGVPKSATQDEIKAAYRKLCMQTHPDVATEGPQSQNSNKFKVISEAYSVIGNEKARRRYDFEMNEAMRFGYRDLRLRRAAASAKRNGGSGPVAAALPRNVLIGSLIGVTAVSLYKMFWHPNDDDIEEMTRTTGRRKLVEAWKNPTTGRWEKPAPWDPVYQRLQPTIHLVPREDINERRSQS